MKMQDSDRVVLCFFGDGASNTGNFHEALNMASAWKLPVVYVVREQPVRHVGALWQRQPSMPDIAARACAYDMPGVVVDGMDPLAVYEAVSGALARARAAKAPR